MNDSLTYKDAGVDLDAAERAKRAFASLLDAAGDENTLSGLGAFGGLYAVPEGLSRPVLVASADGVGTKLKVAFRSGRHDTVGRDLMITQLCKFVYLYISQTACLGAPF